MNTIEDAVIEIAEGIKEKTDALARELENWASGTFDNYYLKHNFPPPKRFITFGEYLAFYVKCYEIVLNKEKAPQEVISIECPMDIKTVIENNA